MKWVSHKIISGTLVYAATGSVFLSVISAAGSVFPDAIEGFPKDEESRAVWRKNHRRLSHWFIPYLIIGLLTYSVAAYNGYLNLTARDITHLFRSNVLSVVVLSSALAYFMFGALLHIAEDAICGKVPGIMLNERVGVKWFKVGSVKEYMIVFPVIMVLFWIIGK